MYSLNQENLTSQNMQFSFKKFLPHIVAIVFFAVLAGIYASPALKGKVIQQHDIQMAQAAAHESVEFRKTTGETTWWTNSMFGGMPTYMISAQYPNSITTKIGQYANNALPSPINMIFLEMLGMYIFLIILGLNNWLSVLGAIGYALGTFNMVIIPAGHNSKVLALAFAPLVLAGTVLVMRGKYWIGAALTALFMGLELYANHVQITYYLFLSWGILIVAEAIEKIKAGQVKQLVISLAILAGSLSIGAANHAMRLWSNLEYSKETIRGKSELKSNTQSNGGLDKDYAFDWSYGIGETGTLLIPNFRGGASGGSLGGNKSETYKVLIDNGQPEDVALGFSERSVAYWGDQSFVGGPAYAGAVICFLFLLGCFVVRGSLKYWLIGTTVLYIVLSWGKNFFFNDLMFDYFPMFNKFRAVTMILCLVQLSLVTMAVLAVKRIVEEKLTFEQIKQDLLISFGLTAGFSLILGLLPDLFFNFRSPNDATFQLSGNQSFDTQILNAIVKDRASLLRADAFRTFIYITITAAAIWAFAKGKIKESVLYPVLILLVTLDLFTVDKRYFNNDSFIDKAAVEENTAPSPIDAEIMKDKGIYKVIDLSTNFVGDAKMSYYHQSLGGYHGAKLRRYQELVEHHLSKNPLNLQVLNMLNAKYVVVPGAQGTPAVQLNPEACGNAWFVQEIKMVPTADEEINALTNFNPKKTAVVDERFKPELGNLSVIKADSVNNNITLTNYKPNHLTYSSNASSEQLAVFSEIFYRGNQDWKAYIDGQYKPHLRADYVLRALVVPAGKHTIEFKFEPEVVAKGSKIDFIASFLLVGLLGLAIFFEVKKKK